MEINDRLKNIIFKKLEKDLSHVEIIPYVGSVWFIDRDKKYWYLELEKDGHLWWRYDFFDRFFQAFSLQKSEFEPLIAEWVEEVLNHKTNTTTSITSDGTWMVEEVLNHKANTTDDRHGRASVWVEEVLNYKVNTTNGFLFSNVQWVKEILNYKVNTTDDSFSHRPLSVENILKSK